MENKAIKTPHSLEIAKMAAGTAAAQYIQNGMCVGLGTGSTSACFIEALGKRCKEGLVISACATSKRSALQAKSLGISVLDEQNLPTIDITVDGADEIDPHHNMIKGGGGALLREKLLAQASKEMIVIVDSTKQVKHLGKHPLPVEIVPYLYRFTLLCLEKMGYSGLLRLDKQNCPFITDNGNYIFDIQNSGPIYDPQKEHERLKSVTGVIETGLFFHLAKRVIVGYESGKTKEFSHAL